jgi:hypothetical protein
MIRASELQETEANLYLARTYDKGVNGFLFVVFLLYEFVCLIDLF